MVKNNLNDIFSDLDSETSLIIPKSIKIKNIKSVDTISNNTSSDIPQKGGQFTGSIKRNNKDIKHLISMLSATSDNNSTDNTEQLKDQLYNILQEGGTIPPYGAVTDDPGMNNDHTHIIYTCCLIDLNVVKKLAELKKQNTINGKITRIYMNINPFNIWGSSFPDVAFGGKNYK